MLENSDEQNENKMEKNIIHPGNALTFPFKGDYVKLSMEVKDDQGNIFFNTLATKRKCIEVRYEYPENNMFPELQELIGEMSLYERATLEFDLNFIDKIKSTYLKNLLNQFGKIIIEVEILNISSRPSF